MTNFDRLCILIAYRSASFGRAYGLMSPAQWFKSTHSNQIRDFLVEGVRDGSLCFIAAVLAGCPFVAGYVGGGF
jgi:hypothetical protein